MAEPKSENLTEREKCINGIYEDDKVEIRIGETQTIFPLQKIRCPAACLYKLVNGELVAGLSQGFPAPEPTSWRRSQDGGQTWSDTPGWPTHNLYQFPDGEIIHLYSTWLEDAEPKGAYKTKLYRSTDNGYTHQEETTTITGMPEVLEYSTDEGEKIRRGYMDHAIVKLNDDSLLASAHVLFKVDVEGSRKDSPWKWRTIVVRSVDRGRIWQYLSTVAFDLTFTLTLRRGGFFEPDLLVLPNGEILCFMATGGEYRNRLRTPLYMSRSADNGKTWSNADPVADRGVYPKSCLMDNGVIAVVYGRPSDWLMFSFDNGDTWTNHFCFHQGPLAYDCGNYDWIIAVAPDTVLVVYARTAPSGLGMYSEILGIYVTVKRK